MAADRLTATEHHDAAVALLAEAAEQYDTERGDAHARRVLAHAQVHATLALIPGPGAVTSTPAPAPATTRPPKVLTIEDIGGDEWTLEAGNEGATIVFCSAVADFLILDDPDVIDRLAQALTHHARLIRDDHPQRKDSTE